MAARTARKILLFGHVILTAFCQFSLASKFVRHARRLRTLHHNGPVPETQNGGLRRAKALGSKASKNSFDTPLETYKVAQARLSSNTCVRKALKMRALSRRFGLAVPLAIL
jgi:hypothetical protein